MKHIVVAVAIALVALSAPASSQQAPTPTFRSGLEILTVEASVRDAAGRPITGLEPSDFVVSIDGQPRRVLNARMFGTDEVRVVRAGTPVRVLPAPRTLLPAGSSCSPSTAIPSAAGRRILSSIPRRR